MSPNSPGRCVGGGVNGGADTAFRSSFPLIEALPRRESEIVLLPHGAKRRGLFQGEDHQLFAGDRADVVMQADDLNTGGREDQSFQACSGGFHEVGSNLFQKIPPFFRREGLNQVLLGGGENPLQTNYEELADQVRTNILRPPTHELLLKPSDSLTNGRLDFT